MGVFALDAISQRVAVVVSTYNGQDYIAQQMASVLAQEDVTVDVFVRDDGSTDSTTQIIEQIAAQSETSIRLTKGQNLGVVGSFFQGIRDIPNDYPYIALCDQDDVWHHNKLARAISLLEQHNQNKPLLYCSEYFFCDKYMNRTNKSQLNRIGITPTRMLYENVCSGNTMVLNRALANLITSHNTSEVYCHDWWIALVASFCGTIIYDNEAGLEYRRTGDNASPTGTNALNLLLFRIKTFLAGGEFERINEQNRAFLASFEETLDPEQKRVLYAFTRGPRLFKLTYPRRLRQKSVDEIALRLLLLLGY